MKYWVILSGGEDDGAILLDLPERGPKSYKYSEGVSLVDDYPSKADAIMLFDPDYEDQSALYDFIDNTDEALIVSDKAKAVISELQLDNIEFLPVTIWNHSRKPISSEYFIVNCIGSQAIVDMGNSDYVTDSFDESQIYSFDELIIQPDEVKEGQHLFRAKTKLDQLFISDELRERFEAEGLKGYKLFDADGWDGLPV